MAISNYTELQTAIANDLARAASDMPQGNVTDYITLAEAAINRRLRLSHQYTLATVTLSSGADTASLPTGFFGLLDLYYAADYLRPVQVSLETLEGYRTSATGRPEHYAIGSTFIFPFLSDATYSLKCYYIKKWDIATDSTNWLLTNAPDAYVYMTLFYCFRATRDQTGQAQLCKSIADEILAEVAEHDGRTVGRGRLVVDPMLSGAPRFDINRGW